MKILILGAGQVGRNAADHLSREEANEVTVVDVNEDVLRELQDRLDVRTVAGNAAHPSVLEAAGTAEADIIVALTSSDEVNMMACEVAFTLFRTPTKIARIRAADYTSRAALFGAEGLSVDVFINPEQLVTEYVERLIYHPGTLQVLDFADGKVRLVGVRAQRDGLLVGQSLRELARHLPKVEVRVVAIYRDGRGVAPEGDTLVQEGDEIFFLAARHDIRRVMSELRHADDPARRRGTRACADARRRRGAGGDRARRRAQLARGRQDGGADPAARRRLHRCGGARRGGHHGAPRHTGSGRRSCDPVPRRPPAPRGGRTPVPAFAPLVGTAQRCPRSRTFWGCCWRPSRSPTPCRSAVRCSWATVCGRNSCWPRRSPPVAAWCWRARRCASGGG